MRVLEVFGNGDYCAVSYEDAIKDGVVTAASLWEKAKNSGKTEVFEKGDYYFEYEALEFGLVDPNFVTFIRDNIQDYDNAKHHNFYVL